MENDCNVVLLKYAQENITLLTQGNKFQSPTKKKNPNKYPLYSVLFQSIGFSKNEEYQTYK